MLKDLQDLVNELNTTTSSNDKKTILAKYPQCKELLTLVYDPFKIFNVTSKNCMNRFDLRSNLWDGGIVQLLTCLSDKKFTGHDAIGVINRFVSVNKEYEELIYNIIDKNLKTRTDAKLINSVWSDLIPSFNVALAKSYDKVTKKPNFEEDSWLASRKLDGVRCVVIKENGKSKAFSRTGKEFNTLGKVLEEIDKLSVENLVFDGEICLIKNGSEDFQGVMKEIRKKDHTIENPKYKLFDAITIQDFYAKKSDVILTKRLSVLGFILEGYTGQTLGILEQEEIKSQKMLDVWITKAAENSWEGVMLRKNVGYEGKRGNNLLKLKKFMDAEYEVKSIETGPFRMINKETGLEEEITTLTRINIEHKGNMVGVGSGFSLEQRREYFIDPGKIIGKTITVNYFEETTNQDGGISLRFPTLKCVHGEKREV